LLLNESISLIAFHLVKHEASFSPLDKNPSNKENASKPATKSDENGVSLS